MLYISCFIRINKIKNTEFGILFLMERLILTFYIKLVILVWELQAGLEFLQI